jgi:general secretion pathway protein A
MYLNHYRLKEAPFNITPDPAFLYWSPSHKEALAAISYAVDAQKGYAVLIGEVGSGKTTILRAYLDQADRERVRTVYVMNPELEFGRLVENIFRELELTMPQGDLSHAIDELQRYLLRSYEQNVRIVLVIDEAQRMPVDTLERLRVLSNLETSKAKLLQIILCGQPEFDEVLGRHELRQLRERITVRAQLSLLSGRESVEYMRHRVTCAGAELDKLFAPRAIKEAIRYAKGNPRVINLICDNALIAAFAAREHAVSQKTVRETAVSLRLAPRPKMWLRDIAATAAVCAAILALCAGATLLPYQDWLGPVFAERTAEAVSVDSAAMPAPVAEEPRVQQPLPPQAEPKPQNEPAAPAIKQTSATIDVDAPMLMLAPQVPTDAVPKMESKPPVPPVVEEKAPTEADTVVVKVAYGESIWGILKRVNGRPCEELIPRVLELNPKLGDASQIYPGQQITVPKVSSPSQDESRENSYAKVL